jgi:hypothetical protein
VVVAILLLFVKFATEELEVLFVVARRMAVDLKFVLGGIP